MAQDFDIQMFFKRAPRAQLQRYFTAKRHLLEIEWQLIAPKNIEPVLEAWNLLSVDDAAAMLTDFIEIKRLASPVGKTQIIDEAEFHGLTEPVLTAFNELPDPYDCAFWTYFEQPALWVGAIAFANADSKPDRSWKKRINIPRLGRSPTPADGVTLAAAVSKVFQQTEARGRHCVVHQYRRGSKGEREYYFAHPEGHRQTALEYNGGEMTKRAHAPAFEVIFLHEDDKQTLSIWHRGPKERIWDLQEAFAASVMGASLPADSLPDELVYDLECFRDPLFVFTPKPELQIAKIELRKMTVRVLGQQPHRIAVELDKKAPSHLLHDRVNAATSGISKSMIKVARVGLTVTFEKGPDDKKSKARSFEIAWPNSCSLNSDTFGLRLQQLLVDHDIEPKRRPVEQTDEAQ